MTAGIDSISGSEGQVNPDAAKWEVGEEYLHPDMVQSGDSHEYDPDDLIVELAMATEGKFAMNVAVDMNPSEKTYYRKISDDGHENDGGWTNFPTDEGSPVDFNLFIKTQEHLIGEKQYGKEIEQLILLGRDNDGNLDRTTVFYTFEPNDFVDDSRRNGNKITVQFDITGEDLQKLYDAVETDPGFMLRLAESQSEFRGLPPRIFDGPRGAKAAREGMLRRNPSHTLDVQMGYESNL